MLEDSACDLPQFLRRPTGPKPLVKLLPFASLDGFDWFSLEALSQVFKIREHFLPIAPLLGLFLGPVEGFLPFHGPVAGLVALFFLHCLWCLIFNNFDIVILNILNVIIFEEEPAWFAMNLLETGVVMPGDQITPAVTIRVSIDRIWQLVINFAGVVISFSKELFFVVGAESVLVGAGALLHARGCLKLGKPGP